VVPRGRNALAYPRGDVFDEGPQRVRIGRRGEGERAEAEVQRELVRTSAQWSGGPTIASSLSLAGAGAAAV
jgi:hypothetical protein